MNQLFERDPAEDSPELFNHAANKKSPRDEWSTGCCSVLLIFLFLCICFCAFLVYCVLGAVFNDGYWITRVLPDFVANRYVGALLILASVLSIHIVVTAAHKRSQS